MIKVLGENGYAADDLMIDKLSAISNIACNIGEISGPICSGIVTDVIGLNNSCFILSISTFFYAVLYMFGSGACRIKQERLKRSAMMSMKLIVPE